MLLTSLALSFLFMAAAVRVNERAAG